MTISLDAGDDMADMPRKDSVETDPYEDKGARGNSSVENSSK